jgi:protein SCO1/2
MTDQPATNADEFSGSGTRPPRSPILIIGFLLWGLCLVALMFGWYQWRLSYLARQLAESQASATDEEQDDGRQGKTIKLVPQKDGTFVAQEVTGADENPWDPNGIEDFSFTDIDGKTVTRQDLLGKPFIISFIFTLCRGPCPNVTQQMREIQDRLKDYDFNLVSLTVDPVRDTVDVLKSYASAQGADLSRWKFLTGNQAEIYGLIHRSFLMPVEEEKDRDRKPGFEIIHSTNIMLVDANGRVIGKFNAQKIEETAKLRKELKQIAPHKPDSSRQTTE